MAESPRPQRFSMFREYTLADLFTLGNAACGTVAIFLCLQYIAEDEKRFLWTTFLLLPTAFALDAVDGWVARKLRRGSRLGADLDSLADTVSFGVAPAVLLYTLGARGAWDAILLVYFVCCGISRLARFNVTADDLEDPETGKVKYFEGTPIPTSLALVGVLGVAFWQDWTHAELLGGMFELGPWQLHPISLLYGISGSLMISTLRIPKP
ncbi:MAG: CDP-diacylglycerol--serine O-phosphatidyltransferase [Deltaproteobacteria bacterium]|nr:CDP-diacylglycerol--serine O-phosphatidyltransferase [Deltaproteobacteria bacterium]